MQPERREAANLRSSALSERVIFFHPRRFSPGVAQQMRRKFACCLQVPDCGGNTASERLYIYALCCYIIVVLLHLFVSWVHFPFSRICLQTTSASSMPYQSQRSPSPLHGYDLCSLLCLCPPSPTPGRLLELSKRHKSPARQYLAGRASTRARRSRRYIQNAWLRL